MINEIVPNIYTFEVVLPKSPLKAINAYVIKGKKRSLLFDTGYNLDESKEALLNGLKELKLAPEDVDVVLTHLHADHTGLVNLFTNAGATIYAGKVDGDYTNKMATGEYWNLIESFLPIYGIKTDEISILDNPGYKFKLNETFEYTELVIGDTFQFEDYQFKILDLIGHTPGHIGLFDQKRKILFSGDTVLDPMTPNISYWGKQHPNILKSYLETLNQLSTMDIEWVMATHRKVIKKPNERIQTLISHHFERMQEIIDVMDSNVKYSVRDIASKITWRIRANNWDEFPKGQKWFALGETLVHLEYLASKGVIIHTIQDGTYYFYKL